MNSDELRTAFLKFYENKGHTVMPSSSLIPYGDPTLLLTSAGMVQMKPYIMGEETAPNPRLASCQKCFRTTDIDLVGDPTHLTFFEMLGNFSIGDYFKRETIAWAYEFITQIEKIPPEKIWATIFFDDDEAYDAWLETGIPAERILRFDETENFWGPAGDSGPCGPDTEVFYDYGEEVGCGDPACGPNCDCGRFIEIGTLVFMQFNQDKEGNRAPLPRPCVDTGMGVERNTAVVQGRTSVYDTDLFAPLMEKISALTGKEYGADEESNAAMRVIAEHCRSITFLVGDGVMPSNERRGYVLRRLIRRAALFGRRLGFEGPFLSEIAQTSIDKMKHVYPELAQRREFILKVIEMEEAAFKETLNTGLELIEVIVGERETAKNGVISGEHVFRLYDTYGFPVELTNEIARERGFSVDTIGFDREMERQRERAKAAHKFELSESNGLNIGFDIKATTFTGYRNLKQTTSILTLLVNDASVEKIGNSQEAGLILADTPFYGEMGGQVGDTGEIRGKKGRFVVTDTVHGPNDIIIHKGHLADGTLSAGDEVEAEVDGERRSDIARNHTATHLLQAALRQVLGEHIQQRGSLVTPDRFRFDFSHLVAMTKDEIEKVQSIVNERIRSNLPVYDEEIPYREAIESGAIALFDEKYGDVVRVLKIGNPLVSAELCGGTHVHTAGEIGFFKIISESSIGAGLRRIEAVTGRGAEKYIDQRLRDLENIAGRLDSELDDIVEKTQNLITELRNERKKVQNLERKLAKNDAEAIEQKARELHGIKVLAEKVDVAEIDTLREMTDLLKDKLGSPSIVVLGSILDDRPAFVVNVSPDLVKNGYKASDIVKKIASVTGGGGGGKPLIAQGGGTDKNKLGEAISQVENIIAELYFS